MINFLLNLVCNVSVYLSIQNEMACFPSSCGILLYMFATSNVTMSVLGSIFWGMKFKKCILSLITLFILFWNACSKMTISLLSLLVGHNGLAIMGLNLRSLELLGWIINNFCFSKLLFIQLFLSLTRFPTDILTCSWKKFFHSEHFIGNEKDENHLVQCLVNKVEQSSLYPIFFLWDSSWIGHYIIIWRSTTFFLLMNGGYFLWRFSCTHQSFWE